MEWKLSLEASLRAQVGDHPFVTTLHMLTQGLEKLRNRSYFGSNAGRAKNMHRVWRGVRGERLPASLRYRDANGVRGAVDLGLGSWTTDKNMALKSSTCSEWGCVVLLEATAATLDGGISLAFLSQFPSEEEIVLPPFTCLEVSSEPRLDVLKRASEDNRPDFSQVLVVPLILTLPLSAQPHLVPPLSTDITPALSSASMVPHCAIAQETMLQMGGQLRCAVAAVAEHDALRAGLVADAIMLSARQVVYVKRATCWKRAH